MQVETYEVTEVDSVGTVECDQEAVALIEQLGLDGQKKLLKKGDDGTTTRCPYRKMTADEKFIYEKLMPRKTKLYDYSDGPIPVRVLQVAAHAVDLFEFVYVWHPENGDEKDPVLVGVNGEEFSTQREFFILARWGEELAPLSELAKKAAAKYRETLKANCAKAIAEIKTLVESLDGTPDGALVSGDFRIPWIQIHE